MAVEPDSAGVRIPPPFIYLGALLSGLAAEWFVTLRSFGIDWRLLVAAGALLFVAGAAVMLAKNVAITGKGIVDGNGSLASQRFQKPQPFRPGVEG